MKLRRLKIRGNFYGEGLKWIRYFLVVNCIIMFIRMGEIKSEWGDIGIVGYIYWIGSVLNLVL